ncbi:PepSY domain-containing protein [Thalassotalea agariperforans]
MTRIASKKSTKPLRNIIIRHLREWHRKLGIITAFFLIYLSISGIALNHTEDFSLAKTPITNNWLLNHYGIQAPEDIRFYHQGRIVVTNEIVWLDDNMLVESNEPIISAGKYQEFWLILSQSSLSIFTLAGQLVETIDSTTGLPDFPSAMALTNQGILLKTANSIYQSDADLLTWQTASPQQSPQWLTPSHVNDAQITQAKQAYRSQYLTLERLVVDSHSGRIFGKFGVLFMDIIAVILVLLSLSGIYIWLRYARAKR